MDRIARVAVEGATYHYDKLYSYRIPAGMPLDAGCRVRVPFGRGNRPRTALVLELEQPAGPAALKGLKAPAAALDESPVLGEEGLRLLRYLKETTFCTWFDALRLLIPAGLGLSFRPAYRRGSLPLPEDATMPERELAAALEASREPVDEAALQRKFGLEAAAFERLCACGALERVELHRRQMRDEKITMVRLCEGWEEQKLTPKQRAAADFLAEHGVASLKECCYFASVTRAVLDNLEAKGAVEYFDQQVLRNPYADREAAGEALPALSGAQGEVLEGLRRLCGGPGGRPALLYGVTGSGKTEVFLHLIDEVTRAGRGVVLLMPEISLTAQMLEKFHRRFGGRVAVLHSALSLGERMDEWRRIRAGGADIVIGTRSAVFAPVRNLGLIVIDEEQEHTYKSDKSPRYHAREVARLRCEWAGATLLLASATPAVESYHAAKQGRYELFELTERYGEAKLPAVYTVDLREAELLGDTPSLSLPLREELLYNLEHGEQSILLLNRRGHSTLVRCSSCGQAEECPHCSVSMTYHAANDSLLCHYCGYTREKPEHCAHCGSELVRYSGAGTQKLEGELRELYPEARVLRVDMDTTMSKFSHEKLFGAFAAGEYDIMIGTQMVAKGLNFPRVTLVGVLHADQSLYANDFRSFERSFSLLTQVVGRCGRAELGGRALVQTYSPENPIIRLAAEQDYPAFFREEIHSRKLHLYPPFCAMAGIGFVGERESEVLGCAREFLRRFKELARERYSDLPLRMLGPAPADLLKTAGRYRYKLVLKHRGDKRTRDLLREMLDWYLGEARAASVFIDPYYDRF